MVVDSEDHFPDILKSEKSYISSTVEFQVGDYNLEMKKLVRSSQSTWLRWLLVMELLAWEFGTVPYTLCSH